MPTKFTPASITVEVPTDAVTLDAETVSALLDGSASHPTLARVRDLLTPRTVTITEGTRVRWKGDPAGCLGFPYRMSGWDSNYGTVTSISSTRVRVDSESAGDYTEYTGPFEKILDVLEVLHNEEPDAKPVPAADPEGWIEWDFSNPEGPNLPDDARVEVKFRDGAPSRTRLVSAWNWRDDGMLCDIVAYRVV